MSHPFDLATHPLTGKPRESGEDLLPEAMGEVVHAMKDATGRLVLAFADGHVFTVKYDRRSRSLICYDYTPDKAEAVQ